MRNHLRAIMITVMVIAIAALTLGSVQSVFAQGGYPLAGQSYEAKLTNGTHYPLYDPIWESSGRLWQPGMETAPDRLAHSVGITIEEGQYEYDGVECTLYLDERRNGQGSANPSQTFTRVNNAQFTVDTADNGQAWALVECRGNESTGFQIQAISWTGSTVVQNPVATTQPGTVTTDIPLWNGRAHDDSFYAPLDYPNCGVHGQWYLENGQHDEFVNDAGQTVHGICHNGTEYFWITGGGAANATSVPPMNPTNPAPMIPTNPAPAGSENPYGLTVASCTENNLDGWVVDPSKLATASTCREMQTFTAEDCPATRDNGAINTAESNRLKICSYFAPEGGAGGGLGDGGTGNVLSDGWNWLNQAAITLFSVICGSPFLLLLLAILAVWVLFFRKPAEKKEGEGRFSNWRIVKWWNNRNAKPEAHDAHDATGKIVINDEPNMVVEVDANDAGFEFEPSFSVKDDAEYRTKWEKLPAGLTFDRDTGVVTISDATLLKRGTFPATLTVMTIGEDHPSKATSSYKIKVTPKARGTQPEAHDDAPAPTPTTDDKVEIRMADGSVVSLTPALFALYADRLAANQPAPDANLDTTVRRQPDTVRHDAPPTVASDDAIEQWYLPRAQVGVKYGREGRGFGMHMTRRGGHSDYDWSQTTGLPAGMSMRAGGTIVDAPTVDGDFDVHFVAVHKTTGKKVEKTITLSVDPAVTQPSS